MIALMRNLFAVHFCVVKAKSNLSRGQVIDVSFYIYTLKMFIVSHDLLNS